MRLVAQGEVRIREVRRLKLGSHRAVVHEHALGKGVEERGFHSLLYVK